MIRRRLLHKGIVFPERDWRFYVALITAVLFTLCLHYYLVGIREILRHEMMPTQLHHIHWLTPVRAYVYDAFIAFISSTIGFSVFTRMWLLHRSRLRALVRSRIIFDQVFTPYLFIFLMIKFCEYFGVLGWAVDVYDEIDFISEFWLLLLLAPIYIFLQQWLTIRTYFKEVSAQLMLKVGAAQLIFCLALALFPIYEYKALDKTLSNTPNEGVLTQRLPTAKYYERVFRWSLTTFVDIGFINDEKKTSYYFSKYGRLENTDLKKIGPSIIQEQENIWENERHLLTLFIYADSTVSAKEVMMFIDSAGKYYVSRFMFGCNERDRGMGVPYRVYDDDISRDDNHVSLDVTGDNVLLDGRRVSMAFLERWSYQEMVRNKQNDGRITWVQIRMNQQLPYWRLFRVQSALSAGLQKFRKDEVMKKFGETYERAVYRDAKIINFVKELGDIRSIINTH